MLMPLAIDMYLPSMPVIAQEFGVPAGSAQMTLSAYMLGFAIGQLFYGPMADSLGRKPVVFWRRAGLCGGGRCLRAGAVGRSTVAMRFLHGLTAAAASVVINALMRDMFTKEEFSRMMSFVVLVMTVAPLVAPMLGGSADGAVQLARDLLGDGHCGTDRSERWSRCTIKETLPKERRQKFHLRTSVGNFASLFRHKRVLSYMLASGFSFAGMFSFLSAGPFVYIELNGVSPQNFGFYFALNIVALVILTLINSRNVRRVRCRQNVPFWPVCAVGDGYLAGRGLPARSAVLGDGDGRGGVCRRDCHGDV